jgi:hypothetical protein
MVKLPSQLLEDVVVGNDAGWLLEFYPDNANHKAEKVKKVLSSKNYYATIRATLPHGLAGGSYNILIENMDSKTYGEISDLQAPILKLYLFWRDTNQSLAGYGANLLSITNVVSGGGEKPPDGTLVAELFTKLIKLQKGTMTYDLSIDAYENVFHSLEAQKIDAEDNDKAVHDKAYVDYLKALVERKHVTAHEFKFSVSGNRPGAQKLGAKVLDVMKEIEQRVQLESRKSGRGIYLIRDGQLYIGNRPFPLKDDSIKKLTIQSGIIEISRAEDFPNIEKTRRRYKVLLKGRPDIKPGAVVQFSPPKEEEKRSSAGKLGALGEVAASLVGPLVEAIGILADDAKSFYVMDIIHSLSRQNGFSTMLDCIEIDPANPWDELPADSTAATNNDANSSTDSSKRVANAINNRAQEALNTKHYADVGQVRQHTSSGNKPMRHTSTVWRGLLPNGESHESVKLEIVKESSSSFDQIPVVSPFAWGKTGLILPRYPGMRLVMVHHNGLISDALDVGAVWEWEKNQGPDSQAGDYWLILPAAVPKNEREQINDNNAPMTYSDVVTQDLIDADGHRIIEVGELVVRVGGLKTAGTRPQRPSDSKNQNSVMIEHVDGKSQIIMRQDGTIVIKGSKIEIDAGTGDIEMKAANVNVKVSGSMDVSG